MSYVDEDGEEYIAPCYNCQRKIPPDDDCYVYAYRGPEAFGWKWHGPDIFCDHDCAHDSRYMVSADQPECCEGEMEFIKATTNGDALFRCPECGSKKVFASNLCSVCTEPRDECVCAEMGYEVSA